MIIDGEYPSTIGFDEELMTPNIDCSAYDRLTLTFSHDFRYEWTEVGAVDIRVDWGDWQNLAHYQSGDHYGVEEIDITSFAAGQPYVLIRWYYSGDLLGLYWGIDDVKISGVISPETTAGDFEPDCDVDWADMAVMGEEWLTPGLRADIFPSAGGDATVNMRDFALLAESWMMAAN